MNVENSAYQAFLLVDYIFEDRKKAENYCKTLQNICKNDYGEEYSHVGVSTWDIPQSTWANIAVGFIEDDDTKRRQIKRISCPQMNYNYNDLNYRSVARSATNGMLVIPFIPLLIPLL